MLTQSHQHRDLTHLLELRAMESPEKPMYSFLDRHLNCSSSYRYGEFFEKTREFAVQLQRAGLARTPVLLLQPDAEEFVLSFWACILAGAWPMPYVRPHGYRWSHLDALLKQSGASAVLTSASIAKLIPVQTLDDIKLITLCTLSSATDCASARWIRPHTDKEDVAFIQYTSGSTSSPRGVVITHGNILNNLEAIHRDFSCTKQDIGLGWLPLHHDMGLVGHVLQPCFSGIHNYFMRAADFPGNPLSWLVAIHRYRATISGGPCFAYALCTQPRALNALERSGFDIAALDLSCWRLAFCGSQKVIPQVLTAFSREFSNMGFDDNAWFPCYGLAESTLYVGGIQGIHTTRIANQQEPFAGVARVDGGNADIKIVDPVTGLVCVDGKKGEIWISSASVSPGYYRHSIQSKRHFDHAIKGRGAYFRTGDLGFIRDGVLYFSGREKNLIKLRGRSVHGEDIETIVHHEVCDLDISQCVVVPHCVEHDETFSLLVEWAGRKQCFATSGAPDIDVRIRNLICDTFSVVPHRIFFLDRGSLPMTTSGKPARSACWALLQHYLDNEPQSAGDLVKRQRLHQLRGASAHA